MKNWVPAVLRINGKLPNAYPQTYLVRICDISRTTAYKNIGLLKTEKTGSRVAPCFVILM